MRKERRLERRGATLSKINAAINGVTDVIIRKPKFNPKDREMSLFVTLAGEHFSDWMVREIYKEYNEFAEANSGLVNVDELYKLSHFSYWGVDPERVLPVTFMYDGWYVDLEELGLSRLEGYLFLEGLTVIMKNENEIINRSIHALYCDLKKNGWDIENATYHIGTELSIPEREKVLKKLVHETKSAATRRI